MKRKAELEAQLVRARGTDFANATTDAVSIGTRVTITDLITPHTEPFQILGAWDSDPEKGIISYLSPIAQALIGHKVGEEVEFELEGARKRFRLEAIETCKPAVPAPDPAGMAEADVATAAQSQ
ncbi:MAG: GreA/GreB family elongation factor [Pedosphaera parvula]|nr:GreA/GreB family elongation factor [Pedosphaera parvula]